MKLYMLDTNICSFIMRERSIAVLQKLQECSARHKIVISAVTYMEMCEGVTGKKASPKHGVMVEAFASRLDAVLPWDRNAVDSTIQLRRALAGAGTPIGNNDAAIAGHALSVNACLVTNNMREFRRVSGLDLEDWLH